MKICHIFLNNNTNAVLSELLVQDRVRDFFSKQFAKRLGVSESVFFDTDKLGITDINQYRKFDWLVISFGNIFAEIPVFIRDNLKSISQDVIFVNADYHLNIYSESARFTGDNTIAGFCRNFNNKAIGVGAIGGNPQSIFIRMNSADKIFPLNISDIHSCIKKDNLTVSSYITSGEVFDLNVDSGILGFITANNETAKETIIICKGSKIDKTAILKSPVILMPNSSIGANSCVLGSIILSGINVKDDVFVSDIVVKNQEQLKEISNVKMRENLSYIIGNPKIKGFRRWGILSYKRFGKRIFDILLSLFMLILFVPVIPLVSLAVKLTSKGDIFFKAKRQGLYGREFNCLKFRSMMVGADDIQQSLRAVNEVDGPQFKMDNDPRITMIGAFLRKTCLDEIPQFFNVLAGDMSIVGPRPSPESENMLCPHWRDARLSVKPGITGYWQILRTRRPNTDFQEWVLYDTKYVREISFWTDIKICFNTAVKLINNFLDQF